MLLILCETAIEIRMFHLFILVILVVVIVVVWLRLQSILRMTSNETDVIMLQQLARARQPPIDDPEKLLFEEVQLNEGDSSDTRVMSIGGKRIAECFRGANECSTDKSVDRQSTDGESLHAVAHSINVHEEDERASFLQGCVL